MTLRDTRNKAISDELLTLTCEEYELPDKLYLIKGGRKVGFVKLYLEPRKVFYYLLKKHSDMTYYEITDKLGTIHQDGVVATFVRKAESKLKSRDSLEFKFIIKKIETRIIEFSKQLEDELLEK